MDVSDRNNRQEGTSPQIGVLLQQKRREKGLSLQEVEHATKIRARYLEGLEREEYEALPDAVYVYGFLKTYANFLGLDGELLSHELKESRMPRRGGRQPEYEGGAAAATSDFDQPLITPGGLGGTERRRIFSGTAVLTLALAVLVLAVVTSVLYFIGRGSQPAAITPTEDPVVESDTKTSQEAEEEPAPNPETTFSSGPAPGGRTTNADPADSATEAVRVTVRVVDNPSYLSIRTDGATVYEQYTQPGFSQTHEARDAIGVTAGNAGAVRVEVNGQNVGALGSYGEVATRTFDRRPGSR
ncbi:MAG TPA: helix-turn-helix domain-containing protein [Rubrobacteraceae bacterium]|nr:helix-turn-helix domain-containing protein [Rubrobacteraceae bacterium]